MLVQSALFALILINLSVSFTLKKENHPMLSNKLISALNEMNEIQESPDSNAESYDHFFEDLKSTINEQANDKEKSHGRISDFMFQRKRSAGFENWANNRARHGTGFWHSFPSFAE